MRGRRYIYNQDKNYKYAHTYTHKYVAYIHKSLTYVTRVIKIIGEMHTITIIRKERYSRGRETITKDYVMFHAIAYSHRAYRFLCPYIQLHTAHTNVHLSIIVYVFTHVYKHTHTHNIYIYKVIRIISKHIIQVIH